MATNQKIMEDLAEMARQQTQSKSKLPVRTASVAEPEFDENFIRREKRRRLETRKEIMKMRAELPKYNIHDIRLFKLPLHEALILQLEETGYENTEGYLKQLFELNEQIRNEAGPQNIALLTSPLLKHSDNELSKLSDALMKAEDAHKKGNFRIETEILLVAAIDFGFNYSDWFWLAEELILQAIANSHTHQLTGKHEAMARYVYAKILIELARDYESAETELNITREISKGRSWNIKAFLPSEDESNTLFMNANYLLHLCYMRQARYWLKSKGDYNKAAELATLARKRAVEACYHDGETKALFIKGECELNLGNTKDAVSTFNKAYYIQSKLKSEKGMCEARVELSKAYLMHGSTRLALNTLLALKAMAEEYGFHFYLAQAYRYLGEYYLNCGEPEKATPLLSDALHIFHQDGYMAEANQVRNLGALSSGLELMPMYVGLLQRTDKRCPGWFDNLIKLVKWKDSRQPFWAEKAEKVTGMHQLLTQTISGQGRDQSMQTSETDLASGTGPEADELSMIYEPKVSEDDEEVEQSQTVAVEDEEEEEVETENFTYDTTES